MTNQNNNWIELLTTGNLKETHSVGTIEQILQLSIEMIKTGTVNPEKLGLLGSYYPYVSKSMQPIRTFSFGTPKYVTTLAINLETQKISNISIVGVPTVGTEIGITFCKELLDMGKLRFIKNDFVADKIENGKTFYYSYWITQQYYLKDNANIIIEFRQYYDNEEKDLFEYYRANIDELQSFAEIYFEHKMRQ